MATDGPYRMEQDPANPVWFNVTGPQCNMQRVGEKRADDIVLFSNRAFAAGRASMERQVAGMRELLKAAVHRVGDHDELESNIRAALIATDMDALYGTDAGPVECAECKRLRKALHDISEHPFLADIDSEAVTRIIESAVPGRPAEEAKTEPGADCDAKECDRDNT